jgi:hypothetical protein
MDSRQSLRVRRGASGLISIQTVMSPLVVLFALTCTAAVQPARAQVRPPVLLDTEQRQRPRRIEAPTPFSEATPEEGEVSQGESESGEDEEADRRPRMTDPATAMRQAKFIHVRSLSAFISDREVEDSLRKRKEVRAWGLIITRNEAEADLIIEITRKAFSRRYTFTVLDPRTMLVVTSGKTRSVLFGKNIANKVAEKFANRMRAVRPLPPTP